MESCECGERSKKEVHYGKREDLGNRSTDTHTRRDPMLENTVVELWSTVVMRLHLKPMKPLWQLMKARLVSPPPSLVCRWVVCVCVDVCVSVSRMGGGGGGRMDSVWPDPLCSFITAAALSLSGWGSAFSANTGEVSQTHTRSYHLTLLHINQ